LFVGGRKEEIQAREKTKVKKKNPLGRGEGKGRCRRNRGRCASEPIVGGKNDDGTKSVQERKTYLGNKRELVEKIPFWAIAL